MALSIVTTVASLIYKIFDDIKLTAREANKLMHKESGKELGEKGTLKSVGIKEGGHPKVITGYHGRDLKRCTILEEKLGEDNGTRNN